MGIEALLDDAEVTAESLEVADEYDCCRSDGLGANEAELSLSLSPLKNSFEVFLTNPLPLDFFFSNSFAGTSVI